MASPGVALLTENTVFMAMPKKGSRRISVADNFYRWKVTGNDGWIDLYVEDAERPGTVLVLSSKGGFLMSGCLVSSG